MNLFWAMLAGLFAVAKWHGGDGAQTVWWAALATALFVHAAIEDWKAPR